MIHIGRNLNSKKKRVLQWRSLCFWQPERWPAEAQGCHPQHMLWHNPMSTSPHLVVYQRSEQEHKQMEPNSTPSSLQPSGLNQRPTLSHRKPCPVQASAHPSDPGPCTPLPSSWYTASYPGGWSRLGSQSLSWEQAERLACCVKGTSFIRGEVVSTSLQDSTLGFVSHFITLFCQHSWSNGSCIHLAFSSDTGSLTKS